MSSVMADTTTPFSAWLDTTMSERGLTNRQIAGWAGVTHSTIRLWRLGTSAPTWDNCGKIAAALHLPASTIRALAGYDPREAGEPLPADLTPDEQSLVQVFRSATPEGRRALLAVAEVLRGLSQESDESSTGL
jgi:transcriptional regulator with XRE-family HTH domain